MLSLHELQNNFIHSITENKKEYLIYRNSIIGALQKSLTEIFPVCCKLVGDDFFIAMINEYIAQTKSTSPDVGEIGFGFADFIVSFTPANILPYLADVARLEWAWHKIYFAPNNSNFDYQKLADIYTTSDDKLIFALPVGSYLLSSPYPIHQIWETNQLNYSGDQTIFLAENTMHYFLIWRKQLELRMDVISSSEWKVLALMQQDFTLGQICETISDLKLNIDMVSLLPQLINQGWLSDCKNFSK